jgi:hypothetical protein
MTDKSELNPSSSQVDAARPYSPSWVDRFISWVDRLPGPAWASFLTLALLEALLNNAFRWLDGSLPTVTFDPFRLAEAFFAPFMLAAIYYLGRIANASLDTFKPILAVDQSELSTIRYELTTIPVRQGLIVGVLGLVLGILNVRADPAGYGLSEANATFTLVYVLIFAAFTSAVGFVFLLHTARQLSQVSRIHAMPKDIDLYEGSPLYSFSRLTVRTGITILILVYYLNYFVNNAQLQDAAVRGTPLATGVVVAGNVIAVSSFIMPLYGMHLRLARRKSKMIEDSNRRFRMSADKLHAAIDTDNLKAVDAMHKAITSLKIERESLGGISTWPWPPGTVRGFATAIALPIFLFLITRILDRFIGP